MRSRIKIGKCHLALFLFLLLRYEGAAQGCPANIGFESGDFSGWQAYAGSVSGSGGITVELLDKPLPGVHTLLKNTNSSRKDFYGDFPVNCTNGSGYSVQLGNGTGGRGAEALHYTFTIPLDRNDFSLVYYYAVVMQNAGHPKEEQARFSANIFNTRTGQYIKCSSFDYIAKENIPGFNKSTVDASVLYKSWTPVTIHLANLAGATIRLEFTTNDCTQGAHFGYAYLDVSEDCNSPISGTLCPNDPLKDIAAPIGFSSYKWFNEDFSKVLGTESVLKQPDIPANNAMIALEVTPFKDEGCIDTLYTRIKYSTEALDLKVTELALQDCIDAGVDITQQFITTGSSPGMTYSYFTDVELKKKQNAPDSVFETGIYYIKATNADGCSVSKPIMVNVNPLPVFPTRAAQKTILKPATFDLTKVFLTAGNLSYWQDSAATKALANPTLIDKNGTYFIKATTTAGCEAITSVTATFIDPSLAVPNAFSPNGDGINDTWEIPLLKYHPESTVEIYSRSGQLLFKATGYPTAWDGKYNGKDLPVATYYYMIRLTPGDVPVVGSVTVIR